MTEANINHDLPHPDEDHVDTDNNNTNGGNGTGVSTGSINKDEDDEDDDADPGDRRVLAVQVRRSALLDRGRDRAHALSPGRQGEQGAGRGGAVHDGGRSTHKRNHGAVMRQKARQGGPPGKLLGSSAIGRAITTAKRACRIDIVRRPRHKTDASLACEDDGRRPYRY